MNGKRRRNFEGSLFVASDFPLNLPRAKNTTIEFESTDTSWTLRTIRVCCMTKIRSHLLKMYLSDKIITYDTRSHPAPCYPIHITSFSDKKKISTCSGFTCKIVTTLSLPANKAPFGNTNLSSVSSRMF